MFGRPSRFTKSHRSCGALFRRSFNSATRDFGIGTVRLSWLLGVKPTSSFLRMWNSLLPQLIPATTRMRLPFLGNLSQGKTYNERFLLDPSRRTVSRVLPPRTELRLPPSMTGISSLGIRALIPFFFSRKNTMFSRVFDRLASVTLAPHEPLIITQNLFCNLIEESDLAL